MMTAAIHSIGKASALPSGPESPPLQMESPTAWDWRKRVSLPSAQKIWASREASKGSGGPNGIPE